MLKSVSGESWEILFLAQSLKAIGAKRVATLSRACWDCRIIKRSKTLFGEKPGQYFGEIECNLVSG
ncbi:hypothetical protein D7I46_00995 [Lactococcus allomyrinae]|uniref:Uncharacterized protein n=1 Tax=Lactococcus allomyrinae TaxID=2419773 RepID=A0A387BFA4_9LACT|nr:hypothetical protein D7I46_00995 [Lactococcus allomyrinae]